MLKAVRVIAYQNMPNYRKPTAIAIQDSYPLPPYSTVIGFVHTCCGYEEYQPMKVSIAGKSKSLVADMYTRYFHGNRKLEIGRHQLYTEKDPSCGLGGWVTPKLDTEHKIGITRGLGYMQLLVDVELAIYIVPDNPDQLEEIKNGLLYPKRYPALGRHEDILRIDDVEIVELKRLTDEESDEQAFTMEYDALIPLDIIDELELETMGRTPGTVFNFNKVFYVDKAEKKPYRKILERVKAKLVKSGTLFTVNAYYDDTYKGQKIGVFLA